MAVDTAAASELRKPRQVEFDEVLSKNVLLGHVFELLGDFFRIVWKIRDEPSLLLLE